MGDTKELLLFGGESGWKESDWTASDDQVRGGKSQSYLDCHGSTARFYGNLDIKTLGGAGFASQRTTSENKTWDLSCFAGIAIDFVPSGAQNVAHTRKVPSRYTFLVKDKLLPRNPDNGREQATINYEYDFFAGGGTLSNQKGNSIFIPWVALKATYRGKEKKDAPKLDLRRVKRFSIMMRSFFGDQEGDFSLTLKTVKAVKYPKDLEKGLQLSDEQAFPEAETEKSAQRRPIVAILTFPVFLLALYWTCQMICPKLREWMLPQSR